MGTADGHQTALVGTRSAFVAATVRSVLESQATFVAVLHAVTVAGFEELLNSMKPAITVLDELLWKGGESQSADSVGDKASPARLVVFDGRWHTGDSLANELVEALVVDSPEKLQVAVRTMLDNGRDHRTGIAATRAAQTETASAENVITRREREVLDLIKGGMTSKEIAQLLHLSSRTVDTHRYNAMKKLGAHNAAQAFEYVGRLRTRSVTARSGESGLDAETVPGRSVPP